MQTVSRGCLRTILSGFAVVFSLATTLALIALCFGDQVLVLAHFLSESGCFIWVAFAAPVCSLLRHDESHIFYLNQNAFLPLLS